MSEVEKWLARQQVRGERRIRLFCLPFAGGGTQAYRGYGQLLPAGVEVCAVQLPGRERRFGEPAFTSVAETVDALLPVMRQVIDMPYAILGHSLGALTGFELVRGLRAAGLRMPAHLIVSGHRGPQLPDPDPPIHGLADDEFIAELSELNGTPKEVFESPELVELMLPLLRADFMAAETYQYQEGEPLECPIIALGGDSDPLVSIEEIEGWRQQTSSAFDSHILRGDHFFFQQEQPQFLRIVSDALDSLMSNATGAGGRY
jgi:medium-chain acyl-[acyl-carrier-protein] hydrolase